MNGPSPTRMTSAARAGPPASKVMPSTSPAAAMRSKVLSAIFTLPLFCSMFIPIGCPGRDLPVDPLLQFDDQGANDGENDQAGKHLFRLHHLARLNQQKAHPALAGTADHFSGDHQNDGHAHAQVKPGENTGDGGWDDDLQLDLAAIGA